MALITTVSTEKTSLGELAADTVISCFAGEVGITTDDAADGNFDYFRLSAGMSITIAAGQTAKYRRLSDVPAVLHHMPV